MRVSVTPAYPSRTNTFAPGNQVTSAALNGMQDGTIAVSTAVVDLATDLVEQAPESQTCTADQVSSPAPDVGGAKTVWMETVTNGTTEVVIDTSIDYRDRIGMACLVGASSLTVPGGANDGTSAQWTYGTTPGFIMQMFYTEQGQTGASNTPGFYDSAHVFYSAGSDHVRIYARNTDGALCMKKDASADANIPILGFIHFGPNQNHY